MRNRFLLPEIVGEKESNHLSRSVRIEIARGVAAGDHRNWTASSSRGEAARNGPVLIEVSFSGEGIGRRVLSSEVSYNVGLGGEG